ncbi:MAG: hypothetical protein NTY67_14100 [Cyanobacteria bacterium]|nr:hypothetical protein [Cyanobacteriota bacterium]
MSAKVRELAEIAKSDLVRACGYISIKRDGNERINFRAFDQAPLGAKGANLKLGRRQIRLVSVGGTDEED